MQEKSIYTYFSFGAGTRFLQTVGEGAAIRGTGMVLANIKSFFKRLDELDLQVTKRVAITNGLEKIAEKFETATKDQKLTEAEAKELNKAIVGLRPTLNAEIQGFMAFLVTPKRIDIDKLLANVPNLFADSRFNKLPAIAQYDFIEAGKCIAFERSTAAAFHLLRGTEDVLRTYYETVVKRKRITSRMWGPIVTDLRKRNSMKSKEVLLNNLDNIRGSFRNPTQHPEMIYGIDDVQDLWGLCIDVVNRMSADF